MRFTRGDTFDFSGPVQALDNGAPVSDFTGWGARCQLRDADDALVAEAAITWISRSPGMIRLQVPDTTGWPLSVLRMDIEFVAPDTSKISTSAVQITVIGDVTR